MRLWKLSAMAFFLALGAHSDLRAQDTLQKKQAKIFTPAEMEGTYQIQLVNSRIIPVLTTDIYPIIDEKRDAEKVVYYNISETIRLKILPESEIKKADFTPPNHIEYVTE
jgi:hypothetical protein